MTHDAEIWKPVPERQGYEASSLGRVRGPRGRVIKPQLDGRYYRVSTVRGRGVKRSDRVHRLVAAAFLGPCPDGLQCDHVDGDRFNNQPQNLRYVTFDENMAAAAALQLHQRGEKRPAAKLTEAAVREIRRLFKPRTWGCGPVVLGRRFGVSSITIDAIVRRKAWAHVSDEPGETQ